MHGNGPRSIGRRDVGSREICPREISPKEIDQPTQRIDALRLVVRDLGEQLSRTDLAPEASAMMWRRLQDLYLEVFAISTAFLPWARQ